MLEDKIYKHPNIVYQQDIADICKPLLKFNINYFGHANINDQGFSAIANHPDFHVHYLKKKHYNVDIHMATEDIFKNYIVWDFIQCNGASDIAAKEAAELGVRHVFTIVENDYSGKNYYHFGTRDFTPYINQVYINNLDSLKLFIQHFKNCIATCKNLSASYKIRFNLDYNGGKFDTDQNLALPNKQNIFDDLNLNAPLRLNNGQLLSIQQINILYWLHLGKTTHDIATIMNIAKVSVNKHIAIIKSKSQCYTQFQLGELFAQLFGNSAHLPKNMIKNL